MGVATAWMAYEWLRLREMASYDLNTHYNLYYVDWKNGKRRYESIVALCGMFHDNAFRDSLKGMPLGKFEEKFPNTFFEIKYRDEKPNRTHRVFIADYQQAMEGRTSYGWVAQFENDRLVELEYTKG